MISMKRAREWCEFAHGDQKYGDHPYSYHLDRVEEVAIRFGFTSFRIRLACAAHDVIEDTKYNDKKYLIEAGFPKSVAHIVWCVSDEEGATRKERKAKTYPKIRSCRSAIIVKLCDRIANVEFGLLTNNKRKYRMYRSEFAEFERQLRDRNDAQVAPMWEHLSQLLNKSLSA